MSNTSKQRTIPKTLGETLSRKDLLKSTDGNKTKKNEKKSEQKRNNKNHVGNENNHVEKETNQIGNDMDELKKIIMEQIRMLCKLFEPINKIVNKTNRKIDTVENEVMIVDKDSSDSSVEKGNEINNDDIASIRIQSTDLLNISDHIYFIEPLDKENTNKKEENAAHKVIIERLIYELNMRQYNE